jgi:hypothetical protein
MQTIRGGAMFWKIYFIFSTLLSLVSLVPAVRAGFETLDFVLGVALLVQQIAVFGYAYRRRIATPAAWQGLFPIFEVVLITSVAVGTTRLIAQGHRPLAAFLVATVVAAIYAPTYVASFRYAFDRTGIRDEPSSPAAVIIQWLVALIAGAAAYGAMFGLFSMVWKSFGGDAPSAYTSGVTWAVAMGTLVSAHLVPHVHRGLGAVLFFCLSLLFAASGFLTAWLAGSLELMNYLNIAATAAGGGFAWFVLRYVGGRWAAAPN